MRISFITKVTGVHKATTVANENNGFRQLYVQPFWFYDETLTSISSFGFDDRQTGFPLTDGKRFSVLKLHLEASGI